MKEPEEFGSEFELESDFNPVFNGVNKLLVDFLKTKADKDGMVNISMSGVASAVIGGLANILYQVAKDKKLVIKFLEQSIQDCDVWLTDVEKTEGKDISEAGGYH